MGVRQFADGKVLRFSVVALLTLLGCGPGTLSRAPTTRAHETAGQARVAMPAPDPELQLRMRRLANLTDGLHPMVGELIRAERAEALWARDGMLSLPASRCAAAIGTSELTTCACSLIGVGDGRVALLVLGGPRDCQGQDDPCVERSWVFLPRQPGPLALPTRRLSDFYGLRDALSRQQAGALWIAGFRSLGDEPTSLAANTPGDAPLEVAYASCAVTGDERELLCRSHEGDVVALDPLSGATRLVAQLGIPREDIDLSTGPATERAPWWTADGRLAMRVRARRHALCGDTPCDLVALADAHPTAAPSFVQLVRSIP